MRRRALLLAGLSLPLLGASGLELLRNRRAKFEEVGDGVLMTVAMPELLPTRDDDAMASLESAFATTLVFEIVVYRAGHSAPVDQRSRVVKIQYNPWKERYVVTTSDPGRAAQVRYYTGRDEAIARATTLDRVRVARVSGLQRGADNTYFATVVGQRNPIDRDLLAPQSGDEWDRGQGRDLSVFSRWVGIFVRATQSAEQTFAIKTVPGFYLVSS
ncbi:DUF4390 domain-containing protein [Nannocystis pusilla]|uniref:DUF4390 domain-containing protein n=1 Tax=Nannocystis pusilla TaxID=889268 RepID=A0ABS7TQ51_9BACT|nr:DUF4390 domain-containing protein [Nannocystis pusilla]